MSIRVYFSGVEGQQHFQACMDAGVKHVLASYLYLEKTDPDLIRKRKEKNPDIRVMIDSGAHTFQSDKAKYDSWSLTDFEDYIKRYVKWLKANKDVVECAVELDIDWNVGTNVVQGWQKKYFIPLLQDGLDVIFVWHKQRGLEGWEEMCSDFSYVGLPGEFSSEADFNKYMTVAKRYTTKVHGFAATKQSDYRDWPWFSGDSTTWKSCERYGTLIHWDEHAQKLVFEQDKSKRALYRKDYERYGLNADEIIADTNYREVTKYALISMTRMEAFYERKYQDRTFYYELRLPHPNAVAHLKDAEVWAYWKKYRPDILFKANARETSVSCVRKWLSALAAIQYKDHAYLNAHTGLLDWLGQYFPKLVKPQLGDAITFQKELAMFAAPANPPALQRVEPGHYIASNNVPMHRTDRDYRLEDLEHDVLTVPIGIHEL